MCNLIEKLRDYNRTDTDYLMDEAADKLEQQEKEIKKLQEVVRQTRKSLWREQVENNPFDDDDVMPPEWIELTEKLIKECKSHD